MEMLANRPPFLYTKKALLTKNTFSFVQQKQQHLNDELLTEQERNLFIKQYGYSLFLDISTEAIRTTLCPCSTASVYG